MIRTRRDYAPYLLVMSGLLIYLVVPARAQECVQLPPGAVSWWPADGHAVDIADGNNGSPHNGATFGPGEIGQAFSLDGINDYIRVGDNANLDPGAASFSIEAWVKTPLQAGTHSVASKYECGMSCPGGVATSFYQLAIANGNARLALRESHASNIQFLFGSTAIADGNWHHVVGVRDMGTLTAKLYVDGLLDASSPLTSEADGPIHDDDGELDPLTLGAKVVGGASSLEEFFGGFLDDVRYWARALSSTEIASIYGARSAGICLGEVFFAEDVNMSDPCPNASDTPLRPSIPNSQAAFSTFMSSLTGVQTETFERYLAGVAPSTLHFGSVTADLLGQLEVKNVPSGTLNGTFPASDDQFLFQFGPAGSFQIVFSSAQTAFGFFATDVGDGGAQLVVRLDTIGGAGTNYVVPHSTSVPGACPNISGSALSFGVKPAVPFNRVTFTNTNSSQDGFGFDDLTIGTTVPCSPLPGAVSNLRLNKVNEGSQLEMTWDDTTDAGEYVVFVDQMPSGPFNAVAGTSTTGSSGLTISMPLGTEFYLVAGSNSACGVGPKH